jgi:hypothetical protein
VDGRLPSRLLQLHLEPAGQELRLFDPATERWLPTPKELFEQEKLRADHAERAKAVLIEENERLRRQLQFKKNGH